jgi:hypothetical protein
MTQRPHRRHVDNLNAVLQLPANRLAQSMVDAVGKAARVLPEPVGAEMSA